MTDANLRDALKLLDTAVSLLRRDRTKTPEQLRRELRILSLEFDLLRLRLGQPAAHEARN